MKFKNYIETESGIKDTSTSPGTSGQLLSSTVAGTSWIDQDTIHSGSSEVVDIQVKNISSGNGGASLSKGDPVYIYGSVGASPRLYVDLADADSTATNNLGDSKMPCVGLLDQDLSPNGEGTATVVGKLRNLITSPIEGVTPSENATLYVKSGGGLTLEKPTGSTNLIQNVGQVGRISTSADGNIVVAALLRSNDVPNLPTGKIWIGDGNTIVSETVYVDEPNNRVGINTMNPGGELQVVGSGSIGNIYLSANASGSSVTDSLHIKKEALKASIINRDAGDLALGAGSQEYVTIENTGNVGIRTISPSTNLEISPSSNLNGIDISQSTNASQSGALFFTTSDQLEGFMFRNSNGTLGINYGAIPNSSSGANKISITGSSGNVGIGITGPNAKLHVRETLNPTSAGYLLRVESVNSGGDYFNTSGFYRDSSQNMRLYLTTNTAIPSVIINSLGDSYFNGGNVGIGINLPTQKLHVQGNARLTGLFYDGGNSGGNSGQILSSDGGQTEWIDGSAIPGVPAGSGTTNYLARWTPDANTLGIGATYDNGTNVGIGTTSPQSKLHVANGTLRTWTPTSGTSAIFESTASNRNFLTLTAANEAELWFGDASIQTKGRVRYEMGTNNMEFWTNATPKMVIEGGGDVGIGTTSPITQLTLGTGSTGISFQSSSTTLNSGKIAVIKPIELGNGNGELVFETYKGGSGGGERMRIDNEGNVGIGTTNPDYKLEVNGTLGVSRTDGIIFAGSAGVGTGSKIVSNTSNDLIFNTAVASSPYNTTERVRILNNGNVGIGTNSPAVKLHVGTTSLSGTTTEEVIIQTGTSGGFGGEAKLWLKNGQYGVSTIGLGPDTGSGSPTTYIRYEDFGNKFYITTNSSARIYIDNAGNVSIGGTSSSYKLDVLGDGRFTNGNHGTVHLGNYGQNISSGFGYIQTSNSLRVNGSVKVSDDTTSPSSSYVGSIRYRTSGNNSYVDMMMQTGASTYAWVNIVTNSW